MTRLDLFWPKRNVSLSSESGNMHTRLMPSLTAAVASFLLLVLATGIAASQTLPNTTVQDQLGELPYQSYHGGDIDVVSLSNGMVSLHAPILSYPERGNLSVSFSLRYNNIGQHYGPVCPGTCELDWTGPAAPGPTPEKSDVYLSFDQALGIWPSQPYPQTRQVGRQTYTNYYGDYYVTTPDGGEHILGNQGTAQLTAFPTGSPNSYLVSSGPFESLDATAFKLTGALAPIGNLDSTSQTITTSSGVNYSYSSQKLTSIKDPNGNYVSVSTGTLLDTLGRSISLPPTATSASNTSTSICPAGPLGVIKAVAWTVPATNGSNATYTFCYVTVTPNTPISMIIGGQFVYNGIGPSTNLQSIVLPNGLSWNFEYADPDSSLTYNGQPVTYGTLSKITLPTGGSISYTWVNAGISAPTNNPSLCNTGGRWLASRTVTDLDGIPHTWTYTYRVPFGSYHGTVVTDPLGNDTAHVFGYGGLASGCATYETQTLYYQGSYSSGTLLKTVNTTYQGTANGNTFPNPNLNVVPTTIQTVYANGQTTQTTKAYDSGFSYLDHFGNTGATGIYGKVMTQQDYDYALNAPGSLLRTTNSTYAWQSPSPHYASYLSNNLINLPYSVQTKDGGGTQRAYSYYGYDESGLQSSGISEQKVTGESYPGNQTSVHRWLNGNTTGTTNCPQVTTGYLVTSKVYFDTGLVQKSTDPCTYSTTYLYSSTYYGAFLTKVTNALSQNTSYAYDFNTGVVTSITDPNSQVTSKGYDIMARLTSVTYPIGSATYCYTDAGGTGCNASGPPYAVVETKAITSGTSETSTIALDGLGRETQTQLSSDPSGTTYTLTTYDALGRKSESYNPTRCSSITSNCDNETTWGYTTTNYDAIGRVTSMLEQDGSTTTTDYSLFPCTTVTDEAGNQRKSCVDGLGRMTKVFENPANLNYETDYTYDVLGNLTYVNQIGSTGGTPRTRTFQYDSLSELTSAQNPESGTIQYAYDADSNEVTKTAPSPNQAVGGTKTVATTFAYDKLNRLAGKSYVDQYTSNPSTASASYGYDGVALTGCNTNPPSLTDSYPVGRRTAMCDGSGATSWNHDQMGRELNEKRNIDGQTQTISYAYNLDGSLKTLTYPGTGKVITYTTGGDDRPSLAQDNGTSINYVENAAYAPAGELISMVNGKTSSFAGIVTTNAYNDRLQPLLLSAGVSGQNAVFSECFDFHLGIAINTSPCSFSKSSAGDNGNVYQIVNNRDSTRTQSFTYDVLNRIASAQSSGTQWGETFTIDAWANLTAKTGIQGKTHSENFNEPIATNNQFASSSGFTYDTAGNIHYDGSVTYNYDAENRVVSVSSGGYNYYYDGDGSRVAKSNGSTGTLYWRGPTGDPISESSLSGTSQEEYIFFGSKRIARRDVSGGAVHYYFEDQLGSAAVVENATASSCEQDIDYYPYGAVINDYCGTVPQHYRFEGKERDTETGLDNFGARYNNSSMSRFMTPDWAAKPVTVPYAKFGDPQTLNLYSFVENAPINRIDPDGHDDIGGGSGSSDASSSDAGSGDDSSGGDGQSRKPAGPAAAGDKTGPTQNSDPTVPPPPPTPDPAGVRAGSAPNPPNSSSSETSSSSDQSQAPMESRGRQGGQGKGERRDTAKPDKPLKGLRQDKNGRWWEWKGHEGRWVAKPPNFNPDTAKKMGMIGAVGAAGAYAISTLPEWGWGLLAIP